MLYPRPSWVLLHKFQMDQILPELGGLLLKAIPTVIILLFLYIYFKFMLFAPLRKSLEQRDELTAGARRAAEHSLAVAERKAEEYEAKFRDARAEVYKQQEETRKKWLEDQAAQAAAAHQRSRASVEEARKQISAEAASARESLDESSATLAEQIADRILARKAGEAA
jgi:F-type H+-transporting ATPase subunit b